MSDNVMSVVKERGSDVTSCLALARGRMARGHKMLIVSLGIF